MKDTAEVLILLGTAICLVYLYREFLEKMEKIDKASKEELQNLILDVRNSIKPQTEESPSVDA